MSHKPEGTTAVDAVYHYRHAHGSWPTDLEEVVAKPAASVDYSYAMAARDDAALITLWGESHTKALYIFADPKSKLQSAWHCTVEGGPIDFEVEYAPPTGEPANQ